MFATLLLAAAASLPAAAVQYKVVAWNDLGMHCMDADYGVFSILPPYNNLHAQVLDVTNGKVTIKHGDILHMDMPGMTMVFTVKDKSLLSQVKPGDKVKFMVVNEGGKLVVTDIQPAQ